MRLLVAVAVLIGLRMAQAHGHDTAMVHTMD